jgi:hypothetical protein
MTSPRRAPLPFFAAFLALGLPLLPSLASAGAYLSKTAGLVQIKSGSQDRWDPVRTVPQPVTAGDSVRTGLRAQATLQFEDGSHVELGSNASFTLEEASGSRSLLNLGFGAIKVWVQRLGSRRFQVRTPTAVCSVRGTEFRVEVMPGGRTTVDLYKGLLGVEDHRGQQVLLHPNERLQVDLRGIGLPTALPSQTSIQRSNFHQLMQKEMVLDLSKEQVMAAAIGEIKAAEFQQGKSLTDAFGHRVRVEQYIVRPAANQFKLVVLNERKASFNYFYYLGTFNQTLPTDMTVALKQLNGGIDTAPDYFLTSFESGRSNTIDSLVEKGTGGHLVDVNNNTDNTDDVSLFFDQNKGRWVDAVGRSVWQTRFDNYGMYVDGNLKIGWTGANIQTYNQGWGADSPTLSTTNDPFTNALLASATPSDGGTTRTFPDSNQVHELIYHSFSDGSFISFDNYLIDDAGKIASPSDFAGYEVGSFTGQQKLMQFNYEQVTTATEFGGRKIDLVVAPKILIQAGLIQ